MAASAEPAPAGGSSEKDNEAGDKTNGNGGKKIKKTLTYSDLGIFGEQPKRSDMAVLQKRIDTFAGKWKACRPQTPAMMAEAGMYYAGYKDCVRCFFCDGRLFNWDRHADPWIRHALFYPKCAYIHMRWGGKFVEIVQKNRGWGRGMTLAEVEAQLEAQLEAETKSMPPSLEDGDVHVAGGDAQAAGGGAGKHFDAAAVKKLDEENKQLKSDMTCKICMDKYINIVFLPCGHMVACSQCGVALKMCPLCRKYIAGKVKAILA